MKLKLKKIISPLLAGLFLTFSRQINFLTSNQNSYFLHGLRLNNPNFIPQDWFTWKVFHHHFAFGYLISFLQKLGPLILTTTLTQLLLMIILSLGLFLLCQRFCKHPQITFLILIVWLRLVGVSEIGLGWQYLTNNYLQPSEVAGPLMILGLALLFTKRYFWSSLALGLGGLFHGAYLSSFAPVVFITAWTTKLHLQKKSLLKFVLPLGVLWGFFALIVIKAFIISPSASIDTNAIMVNLRAPGDFIIKNWSLKWSLAWLSWMVISTPIVFTLPSGKKLRPLKISVLASLAIIALGILQTTFLKINSLTLLMPWRLSFCPLIISLIFTIDYFIQFVKTNKLKHPKLILPLTLLGISTLFIIRWGFHLSRIRFLWLASLPLAIIIKYFTKSFKLSIICLYILMLTIATSFLVSNLKNPIQDNLNYPSNTSLVAMEDWARKNTPQDAIFIIPPDMEFFRIRAQRAVVIDWKSACYLPTDLEQWYQRLSDISGLSDKHLIVAHSSISDGYRQLGYHRAKMLKQKYQASYLIVSSLDHLGDLEGLTPQFINANYLIFKI